jgi:hypothetical protein
MKVIEFRDMGGGVVIAAEPWPREVAFTLQLLCDARKDLLKIVGGEILINVANGYATYQVTGCDEIGVVYARQVGDDFWTNAPTMADVAGIDA